MKTKFILFLALIATLSSCVNNDNVNNVNLSESDIAGVWNVTDVLQVGTATTNFFGQEIVSTFSNTGREFDFTYDFGLDPNTITANGSYISIISITVDGQTETEEAMVSTVEGLNTGTWSINGNIMSVTADGETNEVAITEYTGNRMVFTVQYLIEFGEQGISVVNEGTLTLTLER